MTCVILTCTPCLQQHEQTHHEEELRRLDATRHVAPAADGPADQDDQPLDDDEFMRRHALRQAELNNELLVRG